MHYLIPPPGQPNFPTLEAYCQYTSKLTNYAQRMDALILSKVLDRPIIFVSILDDAFGKREVAEVFLPYDDREVNYRFR